MDIEYNGKTVHTEAADLAQFLAEQQVDASRVATAIDGDFVPRTQYADTPLAAGMKLEVLAPMQGG